MHLGPRRVVAPDGTVWRVGRRWLPDLSPPRWRGHNRRGDNVDGPDLPGNSFGVDVTDMLTLSLVIGFLVLVLFVITAWIVPLLILVIEAVVLLLAAAAGLIGRVVSRRPWVVRARSDDGRQQDWNVIGFKASGARRDAIARELATTGRCGGWDSNPHVLADTGT